MKKITTLLILTTICFSVFSQNTFGEIGSFWKYSYKSHNGNGGGQDMIEIVGDTLISGTNFKILKGTHYRYTAVPFEEYYYSSNIGLMQITDDSVLINNNLILDFEMEIDDSIFINAQGTNIQLAIDSIKIDTIYGNEYRKWYGQQICIDHPDTGIYDDFIILESIGGIGHDYLLWNSDGCIIGGGSRSFICYQNGDFSFPINSDCEPLLIVGAEDINTEKNITVFPNPVNHEINIVTENQRIKSIRIFDAIGRKKLSFECSSEICTLSLDKFKEGVYFVEIKYDNKIILRKIIKN